MLEAITILMQEGYQLHCGPHGGGLTGYYAVLFKDDTESFAFCEECEQPVFDWDDVAHAHTLPQALEKAILKARGGKLRRVHPRVFRRTRRGSSKELYEGDD